MKYNNIFIWSLIKIHLVICFSICGYIEKGF